MFERRVRDITNLPGEESRAFMPTGRLLERLGLFDSQTRVEVERIRRLRNNLVHGVEIPDPADIREAADRLLSIVGSLPNVEHAV